MATPLLVLIILAIVIIASIITSVVTYVILSGRNKRTAWQSNTASLVLQNNI